MSSDANYLSTSDLSTSDLSTSDHSNANASMDSKAKKHPNDYPRVQFQVTNPELNRAIESRAARASLSYNTASRRDLGRYYKLLRIALPGFSRSEARLICDVFNGTLFEPIELSLSYLWASLSDAQEAYFQKHGVEKKPFVERFKTFSRAENLAIIDAIERFWASGGSLSVSDVGLAVQETQDAASQEND